MILIVLLGFVIFLLINIPLAFAMGLSSLIYILLSGKITLGIILQKVVGGTDSFALMAVPFYILAGELMNASGITDRLIRFSSTLVGHIRGGLGHVTVVANMIMAGISGSAIADAAGTGTILIPAMKKQGYGSAFSAVVVASAATIGPIIPPSITMVIIGVATETSVGKLFMGGFIPGICIGLSLMVLIYFISKKRGYPKDERAKFIQILKAFKDSVFALVMPLIIVGGILGGVFTPTEAGAVAAAYAFFAGIFIFREIKLQKLPDLLYGVTLTTAKVMFIIGAASLFGWILTFEQVPKLVSQAIFSISNNKYVILLIINIFYLILGCLMETVAAIFLTAPILMPLVVALGVDPVHFGLIMTVNLLIGTLTPPVAVVMYVVNSIANITVEEFIKELTPFLIILIAMLLLITYFPPLVMFLPNLFFK
jgi:tripartite ATP-independent transporter DctM subunit